MVSKALGIAGAPAFALALFVVVRRRRARVRPIARSALVALGPAELAAQIDWP